MKHGRSAYAHGKCQCDICTAAQAAYTRLLRERKKGALAPDDERHGTSNAYSTYNCRCAACTTAKREANKAYRTWKASR